MDGSFGPQEGQKRCSSNTFISCSNMLKTPGMTCPSGIQSVPYLRYGDVFDTVMYSRCHTFGSSLFSEQKVRLDPCTKRGCLDVSKYLLRRYDWTLQTHPKPLLRRYDWRPRGLDFRLFRLAVRPVAGVQWIQRSASG